VVKIIYDIGANDGADTGFYLAKGFKVVAVEADPLLCAKIQATYRSEVDAGTLTVVNLAVSDRRDIMIFYRNAFSEWSSLSAKSKATKKNTHEAFPVQTATLSEIIAVNGEPYYVKIDIEGYERQAVSTLSLANPLPTYLSFELNGDKFKILTLLASLGFDGFQIVRQGKGYLMDAPNLSREGAPWSKPFNNNQSGCFGLDLSDEWLNLKSICAAIDSEQVAVAQRLERGEKPGWYDIHARRSASL